MYMYMCIYTYIYIYVYIYICIYIHMYVHTHVNTPIHVYIDTYICTNCTYKYMHNMVTYSEPRCLSWIFEVDSEFFFYYLCVQTPDLVSTDLIIRHIQISSRRAPVLQHVQTHVLRVAPSYVLGKFFHIEIHDDASARVLDDLPGSHKDQSIDVVCITS